MSENKELALNELFAGENALSTQTADEMMALDKLSKSSSFLQRVQLYSKGKSGPSGTLINAGHYGAPRSGDQIDDLTNSIDVLVLARKAKALDMSDTEHIIETNDVNSDEFKRIVERAGTQNSGCAYGPTYLIYERSTRQFYEFFCGNASGRQESSKINTYLPVTQAMIDAGLTDETEPRFAKPLTLKSKFVKRQNYEWFAPVAEDCLTPIDLPSIEVMRAELEKFNKIESPEVETADETNTSKRKR